MSRLEQFLAMGGYASFIWPSFLIAALVLVLLWLFSMRDWRRSEATLVTLRRERAAGGNQETT